MANNDVLTISSGNQIRDIIHIDDVIGSIKWIIDNIQKESCEYLIGTRDLHSVRETVYKVRALLKSSSEIIFDSSIENKITAPSCNNMLSVLDEGYKLKYTWEEGLKTMVCHCKRETIDK